MMKRAAHPPTALLLLATLPAVLTGGCGSGGHTGSTGSVGVDDPDGGITLSGREAGGSGGLDAYIEQGGVQVKLVTLSCSGDCATVEAVGVGGNPPYTFSWSDGFTAATRSVCPTSTTSYSVTVTDTGGGGELGRPAETAKASVRADVLSCPDGGAPDGDGPDGRGAVGSGVDGGQVDGGAPDGSGPLCIANPSFEGTAKAEGIDTPPWANCTSSGLDTATIDPTMPGSAQTLPASDGSTYLELSATYTFGNGVAGIITAPLCSTLRAGTSYSFRVDLANSNGVGSTPTSLQILGGNQSCDAEEILWTSPVAGTTWSTFCATLTPTHDWSFLTLDLTAMASATLFVDHIVPVASCP
ncbi:MAG: hypothetical protein ACRENE_20230 [Polyangiaceae bacterium]